MHQSPAAVERGLLILWIKLKSTTENAEFFSRITMWLFKSGRFFFVPLMDNDIPE